MNTLHKFITYNWSAKVLFGSALINMPIAYYNLKKEKEEFFYPEYCNTEKHIHCFGSRKNANVYTVIDSIYYGTFFSFMLGGLSVPINMFIIYNDKEEEFNKIKVDTGSCQCGKIK
jgi:hypothetical protein